MDPRSTNHWSIYVDGSLEKHKVDAGILLIGLDEKELKYCVKFRFFVMSIVTKYEALLSNLKLAKKIRDDRITIY